MEIRSTETSFDANAAGVPLLLRARSAVTAGEDGVTTAYEYALGSFNAATREFTVQPGGPHLRTLSMRTTAAAPNGIAGKSTRELTIQDATHGVTLHSATLLASDNTPLVWQTHAYDDKNRLCFTLYSDGSSSTNAYSCCRLLWSTDRNGYTTLRSAETGKDHLYSPSPPHPTCRLPSPTASRCMTSLAAWSAPRRLPWAASGSSRPTPTMAPHRAWCVRRPPVCRRWSTPSTRSATRSGPPGAASPLPPTRATRPSATRSGA
jgi:hypothetical protein